MDESWLMINSERRSYSPATGNWQLQGFVNQALLRGLEVKGPDAGRDLRHSMIWTDLGARARELVKGMTRVTSDRLMSIFIREHREILNVCPAGVDWSLSEHLGGAGLPLSREMSEFARRCGTRLLMLPVERREELIRVPKNSSKNVISHIMSMIEEEMLNQHEKERVLNPSNKLPSMWDCRRWDEKDELVPSEILVGRMLCVFLHLEYDTEVNITKR